MLRRALLSTVSCSSSSMPKRKNAGGPSFFAVTAGWKPGIYTNYDDVLAQIRSFTRPSFRRFDRYSDAVSHYFHATNTEDLVRKLEEKATETYVRLIKGGQSEDVVSQFCNSAGFDPGDINFDCSEVGGGGASAAEIRRSERVKREIPPPGVPPGSFSQGGPAGPNIAAPIPTAASAVPSSASGPVHVPGVAGASGSGYSSTQFEQEILELLDGQGERLGKEVVRGRKRFKPTKERPPPPERERNGEIVATDGVRVIYVDGCCNNNQEPSVRRAGCGVWWGEGDVRNITERLWGEQTNQRAEIWAAIRGLQTALQAGYGMVEIRTDSHYVVKAATEWMTRWKGNGWKASNRQPVKHQDLWVLLDQLQHYIEVRWVKVKGHSGITGNEKADALAKNGADLPARTVYSLPGQQPQLTALTPAAPPPAPAPPAARQGPVTTAQQLPVSMVPLGNSNGSGNSHR